MTQDTRTREFVRLLTQNERRIYSYILSLVPTWADADDILQETNLRLWDEFDKFTPSSDFASWAMRIAFFQVLTFRKRRDRDRRVFSDEFVEAVAAAAAETNDEADLQHHALADCIQKLDDRSRELLRSCYSAGVKIKDIAARLGRSLPATYRALSRIRIALHICVEESIAEPKKETIR